MTNQISSQQQLEQLQAQHAQVQNTLAERAHSRMGEFVDTLAYTLLLARQGHPGARQNLATLADQLREVMAPAGSKIVVPDVRFNGPSKPHGG